MTREEITKNLTEVFHQVFNNNTIVLRDDMTSSDVDGWDSLTHMMLINAIQMNFNFRFKLSELNKLRTVGDMINCIETKF